jgi:hypothetical protein
MELWIERYGFDSFEGQNSHFRSFWGYLWNFEWLERFGVEE